MRTIFEILRAGGGAPDIVRKTKRPARTPAFSRPPVEAVSAFSSEVGTGSHKETRQIKKR
jgi:hypothetical protein